MRQIGTILEELEALDNEAKNYELIYNLLIEDKLDDIKNNLKKFLEISRQKKRIYYYNI